MPSSASTRLALTSPLASEAPDGPAMLATLISQLEAKAAGFLQGAISSLPSPAAANAGYFYWATDTKHLYFSTGSVWQKVDFRVTGATSFPSSPADNDEARIIWSPSNLAGGRVHWTFAYDASWGTDSSKWFFTGGPPAEIFSLSVDAPSAGTPYYTNGPSVATPFSGVYLIKGYATLVVAANDYASVRLRHGGVELTSTAIFFNAHATLPRLVTISGEWALTATQTYLLELGVQTSGSSVQERRMLITPIRVTP
jgi:hypothetical protein